MGMAERRLKQAVTPLKLAESWPPSPSATCSGSCGPSPISERSIGSLPAAPPKSRHAARRSAPSHQEDDMQHPIFVYDRVLCDMRTCADEVLQQRALHAWAVWAAAALAMENTLCHRRAYSSQLTWQVRHSLSVASQLLAAEQHTCQAQGLFNAWRNFTAEARLARQSLQMRKEFARLRQKAAKPRRHKSAAAAWGDETWLLGKS